MTGCLICGVSLLGEDSTKLLKVQRAGVSESGLFGHVHVTCWEGATWFTKAVVEGLLKVARTLIIKKTEVCKTCKQELPSAMSGKDSPWTKVTYVKHPEEKLQEEYDPSGDQEALET